jgi:hypothetical protein
LIDGALNKPATLAPPGQAVDTANRFIRQDRINSLYDQDSLVRDGRLPPVL